MANIEICVLMQSLYIIFSSIALFDSATNSAIIEEFIYVNPVMAKHSLVWRIVQICQR